MDGQNERTDDAKTISLRLRRGIISMELSISYYKGLQIKISIKYISIIEDCFYLIKQSRP